MKDQDSSSFPLESSKAESEAQVSQQRTGLTCLTCGVRFVVRNDFRDGADLATAEQKEHYKGDWHRYNLKRKVLDLPAVTLECFTEKVLKQRDQGNNEAFSDECKICNKKFSSSNSLQNHLKSKKHLDKVARTPASTENVTETKKSDSEIATADKEIKKTKEEIVKDDSKTDKPDAEEVEPTELDSDAEGVVELDESDRLWPEECFFCSRYNKTVEKNLEHMKIRHGFFIPDFEYVRKNKLYGLMEYLAKKVSEMNQCLWCNAAFYDVNAVQQHMIDKGHCKMWHNGVTIPKGFSKFYDYSSSYPDSNTPKKNTKQVQMCVLNDSGFAMTLASGVTIYRRGMVFAFHRRRHRNLRQLVLHKKETTAKTKFLAHQKALGWTGISGVAAQQHAKEIASVQRVHSRQYLHLGIKGNHLQKHFRDQVFGT